MHAIINDQNRGGGGGALNNLGGLPSTIPVQYHPLYSTVVRRATLLFIPTKIDYGFKRISKRKTITPCNEHLELSS